MRRSSILLMIIALPTMGGGCHAIMNISQSSFLSKFSLERSVKQTAYKGINNAPGPGGRIGGESGIGGRTIEPRATKAGLSSTTGFMINEEGDNRFIESEFMESLTSRIKKEIQESDANVTGSGRPASNELYFDYKNGNINGRITISGSARGNSIL